MTRKEAGRRGGLSCRLRQGLDYVPLILMAGSHSLVLQLPVTTEYFSLQGSKGGDATLKRYGREHFSRIGKKGGRPRKEDSNVIGSKGSQRD